MNEILKRIDEHIEFHEAIDSHKSDVAFLNQVKRDFIRQQQTIENMAMLMRMMLSERSANRKAKEFLNNNGLMGSPLR